MVTSQVTSFAIALFIVSAAGGAALEGCSSSSPSNNNSNTPDSGSTPPADSGAGDAARADSSAAPDGGAMTGDAATDGSSGDARADGTTGDAMVPGDGGSDGASPDASVDGAGDGGPELVTIAFAAKVAGAPFICDAGTTYANLGTAPSTMVISDFRFYVYDVSLVRADGTKVPVVLTQDGVWQYENVALLDFEDGTGNCQAAGTTATNTAVRGTISADAGSGAFTGISFRLGVPFALDHGDPASAPSPLNVDGMTWGWQSGYKYWRNDSRSIARFPVVDAGPDAGDASVPAPAFYVHLGATGCNGDPLDGGVVTSCSNPNVATVNLSGFDWATNTVVADFAAIVAYTDLDVNLGGMMPGCMSDPMDPDCTSVFQSFGLVLSTGLPANPPTQTAFHIE